jgi:elongation factor G
MDKIRNIGIMAHIDAGKTTTTERILYFTGLTHKMGEVHDGNATMDWMEQEQERGITITSAATTCYWKKHRINIIDTPGHVDFTVEVERCLRILDGAIFLLDAKEGVEAQTKVVWQQANHYEVPRLIFINKMDTVGADFNRSLHSIETELKGQPVALQFPIGKEKEFEGVISLVNMKAYYNKGKFGEDIEIKSIHEEYLQEANKLRTQLLDLVAEEDDQLLMAYLEGHDLPENLIIKAIRSATLKGIVTPVLCGSAYKNKGVQNLLDAVLSYLPSPDNKPLIKGHTPKGEEATRKADSSAPFSALIFKVMTDPFVGRLSFLRVYSGKVKAGGSVQNVSKEKKVRLNKILQMHSNNRTEIDEALAGDIVAAIGLKFSGTGDTLADMNAPILLESIDFPEPVISRALEPKTPGDFDKMQKALENLCEEDPTLVTYIDADTGQTIISGMGELHLEIILDRLIKEFRVGVNSGKPQVTYKETIQDAVEVEYELSQLLGTQAVYAFVKLSVKPLERGSGHTIHTSLSKSKFPQLFIDSALNGIEQSLKSGILGGYEVIDLDIELIDMKINDEQSTDVAFITAASYAVTKALKEGNSILLEPFFTVDVHSPEEFVGDIIDDLNKRKGSISNMEIQPMGHKITALVPLSKLFGYATDLRSITRGNGHYSMIFSHFDGKLKE